MTEKKVYFGTQGPYLFDDADDLDDADGEFSAYKYGGIITDGRIRVTTAPSEATDVVRQDDISVGTSMTSEDFRYMFMMVR